MYVNSIRVPGTGTSATADHTLWSLWNPHTTQRVKVVAFAMNMQIAPATAGYAVRFRRTTARGTAGATATPDRSTHTVYGVAPVSGLLLDRAPFSVQPELEASDVGPGFVFAVVQGSGLYYEMPGGLEIGPGAGLACVQVPAVAWGNVEISVFWLEDW